MLTEGDAEAGNVAEGMIACAASARTQVGVR